MDTYIRFMIQKLRWGILGAGKIAMTFTRDMELTEKHELVMVGSRNKDKANEFAKNIAFEPSTGSYEDVLQSPDVDIVYIATPHHAHVELTLACMETGKHVLCEKPMGVNRKEVTKMVEASRQKGVFLMEGLWSRFNPAIQALIQDIELNKIGTIKYINADFCFTAKQDPNARLLNPNLAGGSLLDVGIYPIFLSYILLGKPNSILADAHFFSTGVDSQAAMIFNYDDALCILKSGFTSTSNAPAMICGSQGTIAIQPRWHETEAFEMVSSDGEKSSYKYPKIGKGYTYEMDECLACIRGGHIESNIWSHQNSLDLIALLDEVRQKIKLVYPFER